MTYTQNTPNIYTSQTTLPNVVWSLITKSLPGAGSAEKISPTYLAAQRAIFIGKADNPTSADNTKDAFFGPGDSAAVLSVGPMETYTVEAPPGQRFNLQDWYAKAGSETVVLYILYC